LLIWRIRKPPAAATTSSQRRSQLSTPAAFSLTSPRPTDRSLMLAAPAIAAQDGYSAPLERDREEDGLAGRLVPCDGRGDRLLHH
jgi:hypothetical protein